MYKNFFFKSEGNSFRWRFISLGSILILFGLLIFMFPAFLVALVASFFILAGLFFLSLGWGIRNISRRSGPLDVDFFE